MSWDFKFSPGKGNIDVGRLLFDPQASQSVMPIPPTSTSVVKLPVTFTDTIRNAAARFYRLLLGP